MIQALSEANKNALFEMRVVELLDGDTYYMPFTDFTDADLYRKLSQYQQGLKNACAAKIGKKAFDELMYEESEV